MLGWQDIPPHLPGTKGATLSDVGIGLIGAGRIAQAAHLPALAKADGARLVALCDGSALLAREVAARYAVRGYGTVEELLADPAVEAVILAVPDRLHLPIGIQALRGGKHILVEKPLAGTVADAEQLAAAALEMGLHLQVGAMKRYDPGVQFAAAAVKGKLGKVMSASLWYRVHGALRAPIEATYALAPIVDEQVREREAAFKRDRAAYLLLTHGAHVFDELRYLLGEVVAITARAVRSNDDLSWHAIAELTDGGLVSLEITAAVHAEWSEGADIYGEAGRVSVRTHVPFALRASDVEVFEESTAMASRPLFGDSDPYERQLEAFAAGIRDGVPARPDAADGVAVLRLIDAVTESVVAGGTRVSL